MSAHERILFRLANKDKTATKNRYVYPPSEYQQKNKVSQRNTGTITERMKPLSNEFSLNKEGENSEFSGKSRERRSRKERSRDSKLVNNRPLSQNIIDQYFTRHQNDIVDQNQVQEAEFENVNIGTQHEKSFNDVIIDQKS